MTYFFRPADLLVYIALLTAAAWPFFNHQTRTGREQIAVIVNGKTTGIIDYGQDSIYKFPAFEVTVKNRLATISQSSCPDQICVKSGVLEPGSSKRLICLPNRVIVKNLLPEKSIDEISE